ncbi:HD-GYP domain-containing protein [Pseudoduganella lutea]|uniref:Metal-dependent phosphohydrolase n=1 Tax=Pseudoduganella lutea TaxID=321985 RepID=A0A4P6KY61_9BURK|nr:HD domain-containing phosphohydrolase [Pseudoduganella lutea]QBE63980.1 metal-dependent phosphohydrolase [Pseudoduganella lutea]
MTIRRLTRSDLHAGEALAWDVFGENGALLVRKGYVPVSQTQVDSLAERGFVDGAALHGTDAAAPPPSVLRLLNHAVAELEPLLHRIAAGGGGVQAELEQVALLVAQAVELSPEVAAACILHNQRAASYAVRHCIDTAVVAQILARAVKRPAAEMLSMTLAALTMNVALLRLQDERGTLSDEEKALVRSHPERGVALLRQAGIGDPLWLDCVLSHHENENGSGYPCALVGDAIAVPAKLLALADRFCARVSDRPFRKPMLPNAALRDILLDARHALDAQLGAVLIRELGIYPVGTFVRLLNGEVGVVSRRGLNSTTPYVQTFIGPRGAPLDVFLQRDTRADLSAIRDVLSADQVDTTIRMDQVWGRAALP